MALFHPEAAVQERLALAAEVFVPSVVLGELYFGAARSSRSAQNVARIDEFAAGRSVLGCDQAVARQYGSIKDTLRRQGHPIPENDIWIAAIALEHECVLVSRNAHFRAIGGLKLEVW